jgi:hypothetical protein
MRMTTLVTVATLLMVPLLAGCGPNLDAAMWDCQLEVQKGNAGKSADAAAERARDIEACMEKRGYRLNREDRACRHGTVDSSCYRPG